MQFLGEPGLVGSPGFPSSAYSERETLEIVADSGCTVPIAFLSSNQQCQSTEGNS